MNTNTSLNIENRNSAEQTDTLSCVHLNIRRPNNVQEAAAEGVRPISFHLGEEQTFVPCKRENCLQTYVWTFSFYLLYFISNHYYLHLFGQCVRTEQVMV